MVKNKLNASEHYGTPLSENEMYKYIHHRKDDCPNAKLISETILTLPMNPYLTDDEINTVTNTIMILV
jgi:UDP-2-acetamido-2-deoxy-ribo-hexuluronate aminotransferase